MCKDRYFTYNSRKQVVVCDCGKCDACRQKKANRLSRLIKNECANAYGIKTISLFVTLTYENRFIPYIKKSELLDKVGFLDKQDNVECNIYRHSDIRKVKIGFSQWSDRVKINGVIDSVTFDNIDFKDIDYLRTYRVPRRVGLVKDYISHPDNVGILYLPDIQNFFKRLKINYERKYNKRLALSYFYCGEYGPKTLRQHFHAVLSIPASEKDRVSSLVVESWKFADWNRPKANKNIQVAKDCAKYVASYVNQHNYLSPTYTENKIAPFCSHTKYYGLNNVAFSLPSILEKISKRDLHYTERYFTKMGTFEHSFLLPSYVISYYFPKFKGYSELSNDELYSIFKDPFKLSQYARRLGYTSHYIGDDDNMKSMVFSDWFKLFSNCSPPDPLNPFQDHDKKRFIYDTYHRLFVDTTANSCNDYIRNVRMLLNARGRFFNDFYHLFGESVDLSDYYAQCAVDVWTIRASNAIKDSYEQFNDDERYLYSVYDPNLTYRSNHFVSSLDEDFRLREQFFIYDKAKKVSNEALSASQNNF